jgi:acyl carrier protein
MHTTFTCPASFAQERFWLAHQLDPADLSANLTWTFRIEGPLRVDSLRQALNELVDRHEILRTTFTTVDGRPVQVVSRTLTLPLQVEHRECDGRTWAEAAATIPFDLVRGPLIDARLLRSADDLHYLLLRLHHIVADAWSIGLLFKELGILYGHGTLPALALQYADFVAWQRDPRRERAFAEQLAFWNDRLTDAEPSRLPHDSAQAARRAPGSLRIDLPTELVEELRALAAERRVTLYMCLLAAFCVALRLRLRERAHVVVGAPVADRPDQLLDGVIGPFVNTVVLDVDTSGDPTFGALLARVRDTCLDAQDNRDVPFERVVELLRPGRRPGSNPLVETLFVLHSRGLPYLRLAGLDVQRVETRPAPPPLDLVVSLVEEGRAVGGRFDYSADRYAPQTVARLAADFSAVLHAAAARPEERLSALLPDDGLRRTAEPPRAKAPPPVAAPSGSAEVEREVCAIWAEVLGVDRVEVDDDFFDIGGYSLLAVQILTRVEERFGVKLTVREFFEHPTVAELSGLL